LIEYATVTNGAYSNTETKRVIVDATLSKIEMYASAVVFTQLMASFNEYEHEL